jgi:hypothetical protein
MITDTVIYLILSVPWAAAGFLAGFTAGVKADVWSHAMPTIERPTATPSDNPEDEPSRAPWYRRSQTWIGAAVALVGVVTGIQWYIQGADTKRLVECQNAYASGVADALDARTEAQRSVTEAQDGLWFLINQGLAAPSPEIRDQFRAKLDQYVHAREESKKTQAEKPYPAAPREVCK